MESGSVARSELSLLSWGTLLGLPLLLAMGCSSLLGLDEREDAIFALCQCGGLPMLDDCQQVLSQRLSFAAPETRAAWLTFFDANCRESCAEAYSCYAQPGTCSQLSCANHDECCGFSEVEPEGAYCDSDGATASCKSCSNNSCQQDDDCCSVVMGLGGMCDPASKICVR